MSETTKQLGSYFWRAGERIDIAAVPDRFTVRMRRGVAAEKLERSFAATHRHRLQRQNLDEFAVDSTERDADNLRLALNL